MSASDRAGIVRFLRLAARLKEVRRQGWVDRGVPHPESGAEHSWAMALMAWLLALERDDLDAERVLLIALVHDLPEALAGDATPYDRHRDETGQIAETHFRKAPDYDPRETRLKHERERAALNEMVASLPEHLRAEVVAAWEEYNTGESTESRFVRQVDKLETLLQAELYYERHPEIIIDSFRAGADRDVADPGLRTILTAIRASADDPTGPDDDPPRDT